MSMTSQGFPLWAVESDGTAYAVVGWDEYGYPFLGPLAGHASGAAQPRDGQVFTYTTTDPSAQPIAAEFVHEPGKPAAEWSEGDIRVVLRHIADRLDVLGATAPARRIREILESPAEPATFGSNGPSRIYGMAPQEVADALAKADDLRERLSRLADDLEDAGPSHIGQRIRQELAK